ncbi:hypothetical protein OG585_47805 (plasmid) [Streptomyces sp. NBC_01340]|uniref:hypothetical protein n=1 Tax=Streptomyces sp. NBC_01340 TaxID=2903830 RepID=UPI002E139FF2|nr:hypothetical protein OG585_47805 [Streptomyces sp. NBC_01340]
MFGKWLEQEPVEQPEGELHYEALVESGELGDEELMDQLGRDVARNYLNPSELALVFDDLGSPEVADYLRANKFPTRVAVRHGDFGEIVTAIPDGPWKARLRLESGTVKREVTGRLTFPPPGGKSIARLLRTQSTGAWMGIGGSTLALGAAGFAHGRAPPASAVSVELGIGPRRSLPEAAHSGPGRHQFRTSHRASPRPCSEPEQ